MDFPLVKLRNLICGDLSLDKKGLLSHQEHRRELGAARTCGASPELTQGQRACHCCLRLLGLLASFRTRLAALNSRTVSKPACFSPKRHVYPLPTLFLCSCRSGEGPGFIRVVPRVVHEQQCCVSQTLTLLAGIESLWGSSPA